MEFKFRQKGEVKTVNLPINDNTFATDLDFPVVKSSNINKPADLEGIDLTGYSVIYSRFGRHGHEAARDLHKKIPSVIVLYKYAWCNGWGEGILLPENFNPGKVKFYKTKKQMAIEAEKVRLASFMAVYASIKESLPDYNVRTNVGDTRVEISPKQESFSCDGDWKVKATNMEEALAGIKEKEPLWKEWNGRALEVFLRLSGKPNPGFGNLDISPSPSYAKTVGVELDLNTHKWVWFHKQEDGSWKEGEIHNSSPSSY